MQTFPDYTNRKGEKFNIRFEEPSVLEEANYWGFYYKVTDSKKRHRRFRFVVKKEWMPDKRVAENFSQGLPLEALHRLLETTEDGSPLFLPDASKGWEVF
jgi:hypothetical protein